MGMNLDELKALCEAQVDLIKQTEKEIEDTKDMFALRVKSNLENFIQPLFDLYKSIYKTVEKVISVPNFEHSPLDETIYLGATFWLLTSKSNMYVCSNDCDDLLRMSSTSVIAYLKRYSNTDETMKLADAFKIEIAKRLEKMADVLKKKNEELSATLSELKANLEQSSTVEQVSENTVRVQIGGKTYIGTLEEN